MTGTGLTETEDHSGRNLDFNLDLDLDLDVDLGHASRGVRLDY